MKKELSIYLDLVRFTAAMTVFLGHASGKLTGGFLWQLGSYLDTAVMIFFVLSGFVIAFVYDVKEKTLTDYSIARVSRLSSVVIPALLLTIICDQVGILVNHELYYGGPWPAPVNNVANYVLSLFLVQNLWGLDLNPGINLMFWSLSFELVFYCLFAALFYLKGKQRIIVFIVICLLSGPDILLYFPIWLLGTALYFITKKDISFISSFPRLSAGLSFVFLAVLLIATPWLNKHFNYSAEFMISPRHIIADYIAAIIFSLHLLFINPLLKRVHPLLHFFAKPISFFAALTFSLYLFHRPLIQFFAAFSSDLSSWESRLLVVGGSFMVVVVIGYWCETTKYPIKKWLAKSVNKSKSYVS